jgi:PcfJ-like protein
VWTITELLASRALIHEGQAMRHCVATYAARCARRQTTIWSMEVENRRGRHRVLTIEVDAKTRTVCQARRMCNRLPHVPEREVLEQWAAVEGLRIPEWVHLG